MITAEIISYSRSKGLFAGVDVSGGMLRPDEDANKSHLRQQRHADHDPRDARDVGAAGSGRLPHCAEGHRDGHAASRSPRSPRRRPRAPLRRRADDDVRARVVDLQQSVDRILAETTPAAVGTSGTVGANDAAGGTVTVDRARLMQVRQQIDGLLASLNHR